MVATATAARFCLSVAKLPYKDSLDGISYTVSVRAAEAHLSEEGAFEGAVKAFDVYFDHGGFQHELNVGRQGHARQTQ